MKVKATAAMAKAIRENCNSAGLYSVECVKLSAESYRWNVSCNTCFYGYEGNDYDTKTGKYKAIRIEYPAEYFAMPRYLSTYDLHRVYKHSDGSFEGFFKALEEEVEC